MTRTILVETLLFASPFILFALYLALRRRDPLQAASWDGSIPWLAIAGLGAAVAGFVVLGAFSERNQGAYVPAHMENGRLVPGEFR